MPVKLTCPHCGRPKRLHEPLPLPGAEVQCESCGLGLSVTYPTGVLEQLKQRGKQFEVATNRPVAGKAVPKAPPPPHPHQIEGNTPSDPDAHKPAPKPAAKAAPKPKPPPVQRDTSERERDPGTQAPTQVADHDTVVDKDVLDRIADDGMFDRTVASARTPYGGLPNNADEPETKRRIGGGGGGGNDEETAVDPDDGTENIEHFAAPMKAAPSKAAPKGAGKPKKPEPPKKPAKKRSMLGCLARIGLLSSMGVAALSLVAVAGGAGGYFYFSAQLPPVDVLEGYEPPTGTVVYDKNGEILGELAEERRYVVPLEKIPKHVQNAFIAAEDSNFWNHGGVDYLGMGRAVFVNVAQGRKAQGASTITQQVTRGFLLTKEKTVTRKVKEILLAWRIEDVYTKDHILYLYLNQIYLGSGSYGVEAAARVYFDKHVEDLDLAEAAMIAGLPPAPSSYSPHKDFDTAKGRQKYVLGQMVENGYITQAESDAAYAEELKIVDRSNDFKDKAPWFTEYVRRYIVDKYGEEAILHEGLQVTTTCDLGLQTLAQDSLTTRVQEIDQRMGFRRAGVVTLVDDAAIEARRAEQESKMKKSWAHAQDAAGRVPEPETSIVEVGKSYEGVVLEVDKKWVKVGIGTHEALVPIAWSGWVYQPDPHRSWKNREAADFTASYDDDGDKKSDGSIIRKGDLLEFEVASASTKDADVAKAFKGTAGETKDYVPVRIRQNPEVEASMMSFDLDTGAVRAMVGGSDFSESQFLRPTQAYRQVGSTFKPIVYGAAIDSRRVTTATVVADAPIAFETDNDFVYKPGNYSNDYVGNLTLRQALALSKNTCTVRVLETTDPGMNNDVIYKFARTLGLGGPPMGQLGADWIASPQNDHLCPWVLEKPTSTICMDRNPPKPEDMTNTAFRATIKPGDEYWCRACDYSMALGSASLTMEELMRAYTVFGTGGKLVDPYYIVEIKDRNGKVLESHEVKESPQVIDPGVATVTNWLLQGVVNEGTAAAANGMGLTIGGKTGTSNDEKDAWFVGMTPTTITAVWVGYDQPQSLGVSSTGGKTALPIWMDYMEKAAPKSDKRNTGPFPNVGDVEWAQIDESTGRRVTSGGRSYPFLKGTAPADSGVAAGQKTLEDLSTEM